MLALANAPLQTLPSSGPTNARLSRACAASVVDVYVGKFSPLTLTSRLLPWQ